MDLDDCDQRTVVADSAADQRGQLVTASAEFIVSCGIASKSDSIDPVGHVSNIVGGVSQAQPAAAVVDPSAYSFHTVHLIAS